MITRAVITVFFSGFASGAKGDEESDLDKVVPGVAEEEQKLADFEGVTYTHTCRYTHPHPRTISFSCPLFFPPLSHFLFHTRSHIHIQADTRKPIHAQSFSYFLPFVFSFFLSVFFFLTRSHIRIHADTRTPIHAQSISFSLCFFLSFRHFLSLTCSHIHVHSDTRTPIPAQSLSLFLSFFCPSLVLSLSLSFLLAAIVLVLLPRKHTRTHTHTHTHIHSPKTRTLDLWTRSGTESYCLN